MTPSRLFPYVTMAMLMGFFLMIAAHVSAPLQEDDPGWNCYAHGNRICGSPEMEPKAWEVWDSEDGASSLDPDHSSRVEYVGVAILKPSLKPGDVTVLSEGTWFVFHAEYI